MVGRQACHAVIQGMVGPWARDALMAIWVCRATRRRKEAFVNQGIWRAAQLAEEVSRTKPIAIVPTRAKQPTHKRVYNSNALGGCGSIASVSRCPQYVRSASNSGHAGSLLSPRTTLGCL